MKVLLIEDDSLLIKELTENILFHRYILDVAKNIETGWSYGFNFDYDLIIVDISQPRLGGVHLCQQFRAEGLTTPIILLSEQDSTVSKVQGLDAGADDYIVKPFNQAELFARVRALLRRSSTTPLPILTWGDLLLNLSTYEVSYNGQPLTLSTMEYELLELLLRDSQHVFSIEEIIDRLWSLEQFPSEATVRSHIRRVRKKLVESGAPKDFITTVHGRGYYLKALTIEDSHISSATQVQTETLPLFLINLSPKIVSETNLQQHASYHPFNIVLISSDSQINQALLTVANNHKVHLKVIPLFLKEILTFLKPQSSGRMTQNPDAILFRLPSELRKDIILNKSVDHPTEFLEAWNLLKSYYSDVPMVVIAESGEMSHRIQALHWGGSLFLDVQIAPEQMIEFVIQFLKRLNISGKIMVLDDDHSWLYSVATLLKPWGFKVTTLADAQQFWTVLKAVMPDALVLDIHISEISGLEICQLLRSDPYWCQLPILFLSTSTDPGIQRQVFRAGADDYLYKPIMGLELVHRIVNRLQRKVDIR